MNTLTLARHASNFRWFIVGLVTLITIINYLDRAVIGFAMIPIQQEFGFNDTQFGLIGSAFALGYILTTFVSGILVDRFGTSKVWPIAAITWSVALMLTSQAQTIYAFVLFRFLLGAGEGPHFPAMVRTLSNWLPIKERARALSLNLLGVPLASTIGVPLISYLIIAFGWKTAFLILGSMGILWSGLWIALFKTDPGQCKYVSKKELSYIVQDDVSSKEKPALNWKKILFNPCLMSNNFAFFSFGYLVFFAITWLPSYLNKTYHLDLKQVGLFLIAPWLTASVFILIGGFLSDWLWRKNHNLRLARTHLIWMSQLASACSFLVVICCDDIGWAISFISLGTGFAFFPNSAFLALNADLSKHYAGTTQGVMSSFFALSGILSPFLTGFLTDLTGNFNFAILLLITLSLLSVIGMVAFNFPDRKENHI